MHQSIWFMLMMLSSCSIQGMFVNFFESNTGNVCAGKVSGMVEHPSNCTMYYKCFNEKAFIRLCSKHFWFSQKLGKCKMKTSFSEEVVKKCTLKSTNSFVKIKRCLIDPLIDVQWKYGNNDDIKNSHPDEISLNLPVSNQMIKLNLVRKPHVTNDLIVLLNTRGRVEKHTPSPNETWSVYSDLKTESSVSVASHDINGTTRVIYDGTFVVNSTKYFIRPDTGRRSVPLDPIKTRQISINGTNHIITEENSINGQFDYMRVLQSTSTDTSSVMTDLEKLVNAQYQSNSTKRRFGLELFIFLDYSVFYKWYVQSEDKYNFSTTTDAINNIRYFYTHVVNGINDRYASIQANDMSFYVKLVGYYIAKTPDSLFMEKPKIKITNYETDANAALDEFQRWIKVERKKTSSQIPRFDSAALFTDYTMWDKNRTHRISGLANIGTTCTLLGLSINKDFGQYATIETVSHEIGHNLGAVHDGENNTCNPIEQHIMSPIPWALTDQTFNNPFTFSSCSLNYFRAYITELDDSNNNCLLNEAYDADPTSTATFLQTYPGQKYSVDKQCQLLYGKNSYYCAGGGERDALICRELVCYDLSRDACVSRVTQRALDGTTCAIKSWCLSGICTFDDRAPVANDSCLYGDYKIYFNVKTENINCTYMTTYMPWMCYDQYYSDLCCLSCLKIKNNNFSGCEYGDRNYSCNSITPIQCYDSNKQTQCCATCSKKQVNLPVPNCRYGDKVDWCPIISQSGCYSSNDSCCQFCSIYQTGIQGCEFGDRFSGCTSEHCKYSLYLKDCCKTCQANFTTKPITTTTTTTLKPPTGACPQGDLASWCTTITSDACYGSKDTCCSKCQTFYNPSNMGCEYGDKASWCSTYVKSSSECQRSEVTSLCCASCRKYITPNSIVPSCPHGDQATYCSNVQTWDCYNYKSTCCTSCAKYYDSNFINCEYGDKVSWCSTYVQGITECQRPEVAELCCKTCSNVKKTRYTYKDPVCKDNADWCAGLFPGFCYDTNTENTCCATCKRYLNGKTGACRYGNLYTWCLPIYCAMNSKECCAIC